MKNIKKIGELGKQATPTLHWLGDTHLIVADDFCGAEGIRLVELLRSAATSEPRILGFPESSPITQADFVACFDVVPLSDETCILIADFPGENGEPVDQVFKISSEGIVSAAPPKQDSSIVLVSELTDGRLAFVDGESREIRITDAMLKEVHQSCPYPSNPDNEEAGLAALSGWGSDQLIGTFVDWQKIVVLKWSQDSLDGSLEAVRVFENAEHQGICVDASKAQYALMLSDTTVDRCTLNVLREPNTWQVVEFDRTGIPIDDRLPFFCCEEVLFFDHIGCLASVSPTSDAPQLIHDFEQRVLARAFQASTRQLAVLLHDGSLHLAQF